MNLDIKFKYSDKNEFVLKKSKSYKIFLRFFTISNINRHLEFETDFYCTTLPKITPSEDNLIDEEKIKNLVEYLFTSDSSVKNWLNSHKIFDLSDINFKVEVEILES